MTETYVAPEHSLAAFHCPACGVYAHQEFVGAVRTVGASYGPYRGGLTQLEKYTISICSHCKTPAIWYEERLVHPSFGSAPTPHPDMPEDVAADYEEARAVADSSPRSAAAILRLALQKLCVALGQPGRKLDDDIAALVKAGLDARVQKALDILRISGNNAIHPGELDLRDNSVLVSKLFSLLNTVVQAMITQPREIGSLWDEMPEGARDATTRRDRRK